MGEKNEIIRKNYYINIGKNMGVYQGSLLNVTRVVSIVHPKNTMKKSTFQVKIGELKIIHSEENQAIGIKTQWTPKELKLDYDQFMIGDLVNVKVGP
jgi:hypothetical protein